MRMALVEGFSFCTKPTGAKANLALSAGRQFGRPWSHSAGHITARSARSDRLGRFAGAEDLVGNVGCRAHGFYVVHTDHVRSVEDGGGDCGGGGELGSIGGLFREEVLAGRAYEDRVFETLQR